MLFVAVFSLTCMHGRFFRFAPCFSLTFCVLFPGSLGTDCHLTTVIAFAVVVCVYVCVCVCVLGTVLENMGFGWFQEPCRSDRRGRANLRPH